MDEDSLNESVIENAILHLYISSLSLDMASSTLRRANTGPTVITLEEEEERKVESLYWILIIFRIKYILI